MNSKINRSKWGILISCSLSCFVVWLDYAIVNTALPAIKQDLSASIVQLQWIINASTLAITVFIVTLGRLADHIGRRMINILGVLCFGIFSLMAGLAQTPEWLIFCRLVLGIASAAIIPTALALISQAFPGEQKAKAIGIWSGIAGLGMAAGPAIGGFLISALSWRWIFFINIPVSIGSMILSILYAKESKSELGAKQVNFKNFCLFTIGLTTLVVWLMHAPDWGWASIKAILCALSACIFLCAFCLSERRCTSPIIPLSLLFNRHFFYPTAVMFSLMFVFSSSLFLLPLYLMQIRHEKAYQAGLMILSITGCIVVFSAYIGQLMRTISAKALILLGLIFFGISTSCQALFSIHSPLFFVLIPLILLGLGWVIARIPATTTALESAHHHFAGTASGVLWSVQNAGAVLSIAIIMTIFRKIFEVESTPASFMTGFRFCMFLLAIFTFLVIIAIAIGMKPVIKKKRHSP